MSGATTIEKASADDDEVVNIFSDGACSGNPGPGGWAALLRFHGKEREISGFDPATTNNRMELMAAISALETLRRPCRVRLHTDSRYVMDGITSWIIDWKRRNWRTADKKPVKNVDLWQRLEAAAAPHDIRWIWVRGHSGHDENERVDALARGAIIAAGTEPSRIPAMPRGVKAPSAPPPRSTPRRRRDSPR